MKFFKQLTEPDLVKLLQAGAIGILPTDTVYGLVTWAADEVSVKRFYSLKDRHHKPGTVIAASIDDLVELGIKRRYLKAVEQFWPGPLSVIVPPEPNLNYLHIGVDGLAVRVPANQELSQLLSKVGPLLTTSANAPGQPVASSIKAARLYFKDSVDFYVDGGSLVNRQPSTIIRIVDDAIEVIREGAVKLEDS